ncbi:hypothetical protein MPTK1_6g00960 [Marchantia polymorpha subsp. ruderalis]|uniref:Uncharacterized protein n=2 Tax=Marchantia polymorpha TaxID=3197 RepID=A0AAF6BM85_MARPO|nr:hypothetical protein MARPO_0052s0108 [Marchantia polymorpha]BBN13119.1 hypothetical protein Mp_6g00960 [Marchantia polymorpha subsp. ruderalis]|eukprot:PTQ38329.1 hypothetical protein MARPO_0052s0108 [Marchantia polymorpha]
MPQQNELRCCFLNQSSFVVDPLPKIREAKLLKVVDAAEHHLLDSAAALAQSAVHMSCIQLFAARLNDAFSGRKSISHSDSNCSLLISPLPPPPDRQVACRGGLPTYPV